MYVSMYVLSDISRCTVIPHGTPSTNPGFDSMHDIAAHSHPFGEMPLHAMAKAAAFLPLEIFEKGLEPPVWNSVWQLLFAGDLFFHVESHRFTKNSFRRPSKLGPPPGEGGAQPDPPPPWTPPLKRSPASGPSASNPPPYLQADLLSRGVRVNDAGRTWYFMPPTDPSHNLQPWARAADDAAADGSDADVMFAAEINVMVNAREARRAAGLWEEADLIRRQIVLRGVQVPD